MGYKKYKYLELGRLQVYDKLSASQGTYNKVPVSWKYSLTWKDNRDQDLAINSTSCQCPPLSFPWFLSLNPPSKTSRPL